MERISIQRFAKSNRIECARRCFRSCKERAISQIFIRISFDSKMGLLLQCSHTHLRSGRVQAYGKRFLIFNHFEQFMIHLFMDCNFFFFFILVYEICAANVCFSCCFFVLFSQSYFRLNQMTVNYSVELFDFKSFIEKHFPVSMPNGWVFYVTEVSLKNKIQNHEFDDQMKASALPTIECYAPFGPIKTIYARHFSQITIYRWLISQLAKILPSYRSLMQIACDFLYM